MSAAIPSSHRDLFEKKSIAYLGLRLKDDSLLVNPVWCAYDGTHVVINSARGRLKDRLMRRKPKVTLCISDPDNPYRYLEVRGHVEEITTEGAEALIDTLAKHYLDQDTYPYRQPGEVRVTYRVTPEKVLTFGS